MTEKKMATELLKLVEIMATLRSPEGCPWDREQTPESLKPYILEEAYELLEAIDSKDAAEICDELGDLLLQVVFIAQIFNEQKKFGLAEVAHSINNKLIRRHPHVFADEDAAGHALRWEEIKRQERITRGKGNSLADRIPANLPALKKATKVVKKIAVENSAAQILTIQQNLARLSQLIEEPASTKISLESILGEVFFDTVQLANAQQIDAEDLLRKKTMQVIAKIGL